MTVTTTATQRVLGTVTTTFANVIGGNGVSVTYSLCYRASGNTDTPTKFYTVDGFDGLYVPLPPSSPPYVPVTTSLSVVPGAGSWEVGPCANAEGPNRVRPINIQGVFQVLGS